MAFQVKYFFQVIKLNILKYLVKYFNDTAIAAFPKIPFAPYVGVFSNN